LPGRKFTRRELARLRKEAETQYENLRGARFYRNADFLLYLLSVLVVALAVRTFLFEPVRVQGSSMYPTLLSGEHMFVEKVTYWNEEPQRGDIIICYYPGYKESCVKRVIGLPGERLEIRAGQVYINDVLLNESRYYPGPMMDADASWIIGEQELFVMGDNRGGSKDSRADSVGPIPYSQVVGKVRAVLWPISRMRSVEKAVY